ncbi:glycosyltransferase family 39 protein [Candidatus Gottesmanbacteria bacterium]|nr:glycosyltransferase family 39 protein [Candidatus Gottesmanbacteria bacterium]
MRSVIFRWMILGSIAVVFLLRLHLSVTRAFDPDEFAYLHWTWLIARGYLPYRDFFFYILPGFPWALSPILRLTGDSVNFLIASRVAMLVVYGLCAGVVYLWTRTIVIPASEPESPSDKTGSRVKLASLSLRRSGPGMTTKAHGVTNVAPFLAALIFLTFPVTIDKTIDIRPDMVMILFYFFSIWFLFQPEKASPFQAVASGVLFGMSVLVFPKIIFGLPALIYLLSAQHYRRPNFIRPPLAKAKGVAFNTLLPWLFGAGLVGLGFLGYVGLNGLIPQAITSLTKDALAVTSGKGGFSPLLLFTPYPLIYLNDGGISLPWAVNTAVWLLGIVGLVLLFLQKRGLNSTTPNATANTTSINPQGPSPAVFFFLYIAGNILFVVLFPVPYVQYLLPLSVAASILSAYTLSVIPGLTRNPVFPFKRDGSRLMGRDDILILASLLLFSSFFLQYRERVASGAGNAEQLQVIRDILKVTKPDESVYDMVGSYVFRPDGYFICCHPYAEFIDKLTVTPAAPSPTLRLASIRRSGRTSLRLRLRESLLANQTKFLVMDRVGFVFWKSQEPDKAFMLTNYLPMGNPASPKAPFSKLYSLGQTFHCQLGACVQYDLNNLPASNRSTNAFTIIIRETYTVTLQPEHATISIDGKAVKNNQAVELAAKTHTFSVDPTVRELTIQLRRK